MSNLAQSHVQLRSLCPACAGEGVIADAHCRQCGQTVNEAFLKRLDEELFIVSVNHDAPMTTDTLPCGHSVHGLLEERPCEKCDGSGYVLEWVSLVELQARLLPAKAPACACCCTCSDLGLNPDCPVPDHAARAWQLEKDMAL